MDYVKGVIHL